MAPLLGEWSQRAGIQPARFTIDELKAGLAAAILPWVVSRALVWAGTEFGARFIPSAGEELVSGLRPRPALQPFIHWDADAYASIARYWYLPAPTGEHAPVYRVALFPLYPALVRLAGGSDWVMLLIPNVCFFAAMALMFAIARRRFGQDRALLALWLIALGPGAMFFSYPYAESLFLFLCVAAFAFMESGAWLLAGLVGLGAAVTRVPGVVLAAALWAEGAVQVRRRAILAVAGVLPLVGLAAVSLLDWRQMGDPLGFLHAQALWIGPPRNPLFLVGSFPKAVAAGDPFNPEAIGVPVLVVFAIAAAWVVYRMPVAYGVFAALQILVIARQGLYLHYFINSTRYLAVVFPCYFAFATLLRPRRSLQIGWLLISAAAMIANSALYGSWRYIG